MPRFFGRKTRTFGDDPTVLILRGGRFVGHDFSGRRLTCFSPESVLFERCRFDGIVVDDMSFGAGLHDSTYVDCTFDGARLRLPAAGRARLERCSFRDVRITEFFCHEVEMVDCVFSGKVKGGWIWGTVEEHVVELGRERNQITGNDFSELDLIDVGFAGGVDLAAQKLPTGPDYVYVADLPAAVRRARERMLGEPDPKMRHAAFIFIHLWEGVVLGGQKQQLFRRKDFSPSRYPEFHRLLDVMTEQA